MSAAPGAAPAGRGPRASIGLLGVAGALFGLGALLAVVLRLAADFDAVQAQVAGADVRYLVLAILAAAAGMTAIAVSWRLVLGALGARLATRDVVARYFAGEIGKYLPGGVWPVVGRGELAHRAGVPRITAYGSVLLSLVTLYLASGLVLVGLVPAVIGGTSWWIAAVAVGGVVALHPSVIERLLSLAGRVRSIPDAIEVPRWRTMSVLVASYLPAWLLIAGSTTLVAAALTDVGDAGSVLRIGTAAALSWLVGFVAAPVPGGIGVREAAFVGASGLPGSTAAAVALVARTLFVSVDAIGAGLGAARLGRTGSRRFDPAGQPGITR